MIYGEGTAPEESVVGIEAIKEKLAARCGQGFFLSLEHGTVDAQQSIECGVLLMVTGTITRKGSDTPSQVSRGFLMTIVAGMRAHAALFDTLDRPCILAHALVHTLCWTVRAVVFLGRASSSCERQCSVLFRTQRHVPSD